MSNDGRFWARVHLDRGSAVVGGDWYAVDIVKVHPAWFEFLPRMQGSEVCTLQGPGKIDVSWAAPKEVLVTCAGCKQQDVYIYQRAWEGITIKYQFR